LSKAEQEMKILQRNEEMFQGLILSIMLFDSSRFLESLKFCSWCEVDSREENLSKWKFGTPAGTDFSNFDEFCGLTSR
jgi:hypothetical protein